MATTPAETSSRSHPPGEGRPCRRASGWPPCTATTRASTTTSAWPCPAVTTASCSGPARPTHWSELSASDMITPVDHEGNVVEGARRREQTAFVVSTAGCIRHVPFGAMRAARAGRAVRDGGVDDPGRVRDCGQPELDALPRPRRLAAHTAGWPMPPTRACGIGNASCRRRQRCHARKPRRAGDRGGRRRGVAPAVLPGARLPGAGRSPPSERPGSR